MGQALARTLFGAVHGHQLVYNTCWEDPRLDREALDLGPGDRVLAITSAGCNVLDYVLDRPEHIFAVDLNARQNALLELKLAAIRRLDYESFFSMFGQGRLRRVRGIYEAYLRPELSPRRGATGTGTSSSSRGAAGGARSISAARRGRLRG